MSASNNIPRVPLHLQKNNELAKASTKASPSWETFRDHVIHKPEAKIQGEDRPDTHQLSLIRRNPDGTLDFAYAMNLVLDAIHGLSYPHMNRPIHFAILTAIFPDKFKGMSEQEADMKTQFSKTEKAAVRAMVAAHLLEEENFNGGMGGGSIEGRHITRV